MSFRQHTLIFTSHNEKNKNFNVTQFQLEPKESFMLFNLDILRYIDT